MILIFFAMLGIALLAGLVVVYVAYPHRGQAVPSIPWLGKLMRRSVARLPTLDNRDMTEPSAEEREQVRLLR